MARTAAADDDLTGHDDARVAARAADVVLVLSIVLAGLEVGRVAVLEDTRAAVIALVATCAWLPLHAWHLRYGLRGARPPRAGWTLAAIAAIQAVALALIGPSSAPMLAALATSALIVLRPRWALAALAACVCAPVVAYLSHRDLTAAFGSQVSYLMVLVLFRATILFTLVWLVAGARELAASRRTAAQDAADREAASIEATLQASLERSLDRLADEARAARATVLDNGAATAAAALDRLRATASDAVAELRRVVSRARRALTAPDAARPPARWPAPADDGGRATSPIRRGLTGRGALRSFVAVQTMALGFTITASLGAFGGASGDPAIVIPAWLALSAIQLDGAIAVARGDAARWPVARVVASIAITALVFATCGDGWREPGWFAGAAIAVATSGRTRIVALALGLAATTTHTGWAALHETPDVGLALFLWSLAYTMTLSALGVAGLYGSARLIHLLGQLEEARELHVAAAIDRERRRLWADLHDVLGQTLTAMALKADLARRLLDRAPRRSAAELDDLVALASAQAQELRAVARGDRPLSFDVEAASSVRLLRQAGLQVDCDLDAGPLDVAGDTLLGCAAREGATNILRHSRASTCVMRATRDGDHVVFELRNDGVGAAAGGGTGLQGLADRATACGGTITATAQPTGWFVLRVAVPVRSAA